MRLIDADELLKLYEDFDDPHYSVPVPVIIQNIKDMETVFLEPERLREESRPVMRPTLYWKK